MSRAAGKHRRPWAGPVALLSLASLLTVPAVRVYAHDVKDPACRMTVDSDTTPYRETVGGKTFYFCSRACQERFAADPARYSALAAALERGGRRSYAVDLHTARRPAPGRPVALALAVRYAGTRALVRHFEIVHERPLHLVMVSDDLSWFEHQHPRLGPDGLFRLSWRFPHPGRYFLYADFTPADGDNQIRRLTLTIPPASRPAPPPRAAQPDAPSPGRPDTRAIGDCRVTLTVRPDRPRAGEQTILTYAFADRQGRPVTDMQPFLGTMGHLFAISRDGTRAVHTHALHGVAPGSYQAAMLAVMQAGHAQVVTPDMVSEHGPTFTFKATLPAGGMYKVWAQFMRHNRVVTVPCVLRVAGGS